MGFVTEGSLRALEQQVDRVCLCIEAQRQRIAQLEAALVEERARYLYLRNWCGSPTARWEPWEQVCEQYRAIARRGLTDEGLLTEKERGDGKATR